jgi:hypothetical protein
VNIRPGQPPFAAHVTVTPDGEHSYDAAAGGRAETGSVTLLQGWRSLLE